MILAASYDWFACSLLKHLPSLVPAFSLLSFTTQLHRHFSWMLIGVEVRNVTAIFPWLWIPAPVHTWPPFRDGPGDIILTPSLSLSLSLQVVSHQFTPSPTRRRWLTRDLRPRMWSRRTLSWHQSAKQPKRRFEYPRQRRVTKLLYELTSCLQHICRLQPEMPSLCFLRPRIKRKILGCLLHYFTPLCIIQPHTVGNLLRHRNLDCNLK